ncbi:hypothetical protein ACFLSJ_07465 [Verrucomicrobiota bacterium]
MGILGPAAELLAECRNRGIALTATAEGIRYAAPPGAMTQDLLSRMKAHKPAILAALLQQDTMARQRYGRPPDGDIPLSPQKPVLSDRDIELTAAFITRQPIDVVRWVCAQAERYDVATPHWQPPAIRELGAILDIVLWQWQHVLPPPGQASRHQRTQGAVRLLRDLDVDVRYFDMLWSGPLDESKGTS